MSFIRKFIYQIFGERRNITLQVNLKKEKGTMSQCLHLCLRLDINLQDFCQISIGKRFFLLHRT